MSSIRVLYDHQIFLNQRFGGISRYFTQVINILGEKEVVKPILPFYYSTNHYLWNAPSPWRRRGVPVNFQFMGRRRIETLIEKLMSITRSRHAITKGDYDIFHPTFFDPYFLPLLKDKPFVLTVYDMLSERFGDDFVGNPQSNWKQRLLPKASRIIAISESTKRDLLKHFPESRDQIDVVHLAGGLDKISSASVETPKRYILFVGVRNSYKNFTDFSRALAPLLSDTVHLYCAGGGSFLPDEIRNLQELGIADKVHQSHVTDEQLAYLYRNALLFVFPSLYEGFGIPVVEAMSCGCPSIISNTSSFPEVGGDAVSYFDPTSIESMRHSIKHVLDHQSLRDDLCRRGLLRASNFSWEACASNTAKVYTRTLSGS